MAKASYLWLVESFLFAVALAVGLVPEAMPIIITITLSNGALALSRHGVIAKRLSAIEDLGNIDIICTDKTGTLTENAMTVTAMYAGGRRYVLTGTGYGPDGEILEEEGPLLRAADTENAAIKALRIGMLCTESRLVRENGRTILVGDPTEGALLTSGMKAGLDHDAELTARPVLALRPFESEHQYMAVIVRDGYRRILLVKGSVERVLPMCARERSEGGEVPLRSEAVKAEVARMAGDALRVIALASREIPEHADILDDDLYREMQGIATNMNKLSQQIARGEGTLGKLANDDALYNDLRSLTADLKVASQGLSRIAKDVESGKGTLGKLVKDEALYNEAKSTLVQAREALGGLQTVSRRITEGKGTLGRLLNDDALYTDMRGAVASLNNIMKKVERGEGTLGKLITDDSLYFTTKDNLKRVGKAADQLREQGPLSIIGIGIQALGAF